MGQKILVGPITKGLRNDVTPFNVDNDNFPVLINSYQWRGRIKRKRGTSLFARLQRFFNSTSTAYSTNSSTTLNNDGSGNGIGTLMKSFPSLNGVGIIIPGTVVITDLTSGDVYRDNVTPGILTGTPAGSGTISYNTGVIFIVGAAGDNVTAQFLYYPGLPVMGLEDFYGVVSQFPSLIGFDTTYSYNMLTTIPTAVYDVSFYKNPPASASLPGYVPKTTVTPTTWNGQNYQQFWSTNYQGALWVTNGIDIPFTGSTIGMQFKPIVTVTVTSGGPPAIVNLNIVGHGLVVGDFLFINEVVTTTGINFQTGYVTVVIDANNITVEFPNATITTNGTGGIAQYLTNRSNPAIDCIRFYDGDPTNGSPTMPVLDGGHGWVNFMPPLSQGNLSIDDLPAAQYYLVGARQILQFKDRLIFFAPVVQSSTSSPIYLRDTIVFSQNGTPYYTASYTNVPSATVDTPTNAGTTFHPILVPTNQTATSPAYFGDAAGFGGWLSSGLDLDINTVAPNEDVLIVGFTRKQTRLIYTGNDLLPFNFYIINSELGSGSTFSAVTMDKGIFSKGSRGFIITSQVESRRIDLDIPDEVFQVSLLNNGTERVTAFRDYINEWIYFTYPVDDFTNVFPNQTLQYNYRDISWATFFETYTHYGLLRQSTQFTWSTVGEFYPTWSVWNEPWNSGASNALQPKVIAGNQQGFVLIRDSGTDEATSLFIQNIVGSVITSTNHALNTGDYIIISGAIGTVASSVNGNIFSVLVIDANNFSINPPLSSGLTYIGGGLVTRMYVPFIQTRQFPVAWEMARKIRFGPQQYLFTRTLNAQITLLIFLSQDAINPYNNSPIVPSPNVINNSLIYSTVLFTSPENYSQKCSNLSLGSIGNGIALLFNFDYATIFSINGQLIPGSVFISVGINGSFATFTDNGNGGFTITGFGVGVGSTIDYLSGFITLQFSVPPVLQPTITNFTYVINNIQSPTAGSQSQIWHRMNTSLLGDTVQIGFTMSDAQMRDPGLNNQFEEIELHSFILDVNPSSLLA